MLAELVDANRVVFAGYSVATATVGPSLRGFERVDDPSGVVRLTGRDPVWQGLGFIDHVIVPHCDSPQHPETAALGRLASELSDAGTSVIRLRDGEAFVKEGAINFAA
jgi:dipeptidase E